MSAEQEETIAGLRELVQKHQVCYTVWPEWLLIRGKLVKVGFENGIEPLLRFAAKRGPETSPKCTKI